MEPVIATVCFLAFAACVGISFFRLSYNRPLEELELLGFYIISVAIGTLGAYIITTFPDSKLYVAILLIAANYFMIRWEQ